MPEEHQQNDERTCKLMHSNPTNVTRFSKINEHFNPSSPLHPTRIQKKKKIEDSGSTATKSQGKQKRNLLI